jgi:hypothetical protein
MKGQGLSESPVPVEEVYEEAGSDGSGGGWSCRSRLCSIRKFVIHVKALKTAQATPEKTLTFVSSLVERSLNVYPCLSVA